ncbi:hypothetical protein MSAN_01761200 [Mycena sanguinolenta]|uniref:Uncharacterized protein n=1 Tax=Mycena sanguinolenta TaxID=230812 RepID=A0A8H7CU38_9AGAR|nr:hypothetical protein MSAN_01761200 [Mycena sanguinolenta]
MNFDHLDDTDFPSGATHFEGDFFQANYTSDELGYDEPETVSDEEEEEDEEEEVDEFADAIANVDLERGYEPVRPDVGNTNQDSLDDLPQPAAPAPTLRKKIEDRFHMKPVIDRFPSPLAGAPVSRDQAATSEEQYRNALGDTASNPYKPFLSKMDWEIARWAKLRGAGSTAFTDLLKIEGVREALGLSYGTSAQLNAIIDDELPGRPKFHRSEVVVDNEVFHLYSRNIIECIRALYGDSAFAPYLCVFPEKHYIDKDKTIRMYHNMNTGRWWWATQEAVEKDHPGATIVPIIISSDKTQLTLFGNKTAYPVYMSIGNIPKEIRRKPSRRAYVLLAYLPTSRMKTYFQ